MIPFMMPRVLTEDEIKLIHDSMLRILSRTGVRIEHPKIRKALGDIGGINDESSQIVRFPENAIEKFLADSRKTDYSQIHPTLSTDAGVYQGKYLEPETNRVIPFTEKTVKDYIKLARLLLNISEIHMLNYPPLAGSPTELLELRLFAWQNGAGDDGSIHRTELCPYLYDMYCIKAEYTGRSLPEIFRGIVFFISPLQFSRCEAEQFYFFYEKGLRVGITNMITLGGTGPVTLASSVALNLAENIMIGMIYRALFHEDSWGISSMIAPLDMRTLIQPYGRPEMLLTNLAAIQLARHYQVPFWVHTGLTDAKLPSPEAGTQKILTALPCALAGWGRIEPGLLSIDEIYSPIQMIIDDEMSSAVKRILRGFDVNEETLADGLIAQKGPGGLFTDTEHTVKYFRNEIWEPTIWTREMMNGWLQGDRKTDVDKALDLWRELMNKPDFPPELTGETVKKLRQVIQKAEQNLR